jgi:hypothetical protein
MSRHGCEGPASWQRSGKTSLDEGKRPWRPLGRRSTRLRRGRGAEIAQQVRDFAGQLKRGAAKTSTPFAVSGIPGSSGWTATGNDGTSGHNIIFTDGPFTYHVGVGWGTQVTSPPTRAQLIAAATTLYKRVHGRRAP